MKYFEIESSNVTEMGFYTTGTEGEGILCVKYPGSLYAYKHVKADVFLEMVGKKSRGRFMNMIIKPKTSVYVKLPGESLAEISSEILDALAAKPDTELKRGQLFKI